MAMSAPMIGLGGPWQFKDHIFVVWGVVLCEFCGASEWAQVVGTCKVECVDEVI